LEYRTLGRTGFEVSALSLGTVSLACEYGIPVPGSRGCPDTASAERVLRAALYFGINLFDTAPGYGRAEELLGRALEDAPDSFVCTKVPIPVEPSGGMVRGSVLATVMASSIRESLRRLRRDRIDVLQIHNPTLQILRDGDLTQELLRAKERGHVRSLGVSVYTPEEALCAIADGSFDVLQVPYSLLDQRMSEAALPTAAGHDVGVIGRSALLKGALTVRARFLPPELAGLRSAVENVRDAFRVPWAELPFTAFRFCLSTSSLSTTLVGARDPAELEEALQAAEAPRLSSKEMAIGRKVLSREEGLLDPRVWPIP
jgi:aryl-alcohol dehydrogenase-like predicted oxidoreductase